MKQLTSAYNLYQQGKIIPAFNIRLLTYDTARALFRVAKKMQTSDFVIELAMSEMQYTKQTAKGFAKDVLRAAKDENYKEPIYLQADHYKVKEGSGKLKKLIKKALKAGFYNIDLDCSALSLKENIAKTNYFLNFIRKHSPRDVVVNIGGEVGEIGGQNTSPSDLEEFLSNVKVNKVAVQTGTAHSKGGQIDWQLLRQLSAIAKKHGLPGIVQHGASTLSKDDLSRLAENGVCEAHLATEIMQAILQNPIFPFKIQKQEIGHYKKKINKLPTDVKKQLMQVVEAKFSFFFDCLRSY